MRGILMIKPLTKKKFCVLFFLISNEVLSAFSGGRSFFIPQPLYSILLNLNTHDNDSLSEVVLKNSTIQEPRDNYFTKHYTSLPIWHPAYQVRDNFSYKNSFYSRESNNFTGTDSVEVRKKNFFLACIPFLIPQ